MKLSSAWVSILSLTIFVGCTEQPLPEDEVAGVEQDAVSHDEQGPNVVDQNGLDWNGLDWNGLDWNGLDWNGLDWNGLDWNGLDWNNLDPNSTNGVILASIQDTGSSGNVARAVVRHLVRCAFDSSRAFTFTWVDAGGATHAERYVGSLGLAPHWEDHPLGLTGERLVSACMAAHVNYYGQPVLISIRSGDEPLRLSRYSSELRDYPDVEGAFWGNLWGTERKIYACYNRNNIDNSRFYKRDCAAGHRNSNGTISECGIIDIVGSCRNVCRTFSHSRGYYEDCLANPGTSWQRTDLVITTALP